MYFKARGAHHVEQVMKSKRARRARARAFLLEHLRANPCIDCGERDPVVLEFDHLREKISGVAAMSEDGASPRRLAAEIAKCQVVCVNCHRRRTARRRGSYRLPGSEQRLEGRPTRARRNIRWLLGVLASSACADCAEADPVVLEFDHVGPKRAALPVLAYGIYSIATLEAELAQCVVRCANCHRRRTAAEGGHYRHTALESAPAPP